MDQQHQDDRLGEGGRRLDLFLILLGVALVLALLVGGGGFLMYRVQQQRVTAAQARARQSLEQVRAALEAYEGRAGITPPPVVPAAP